MPTRYFYSDLPVLTDFVQITDHHNFVAVPDDWLIVITDIIGSTRAIEQGRYKDVNLLGACLIVSVLNLECRWQDIPSRYGETVSLLVLATHDEEYRDLIEQIQLNLWSGRSPLFIFQPQHTS
ncbi:DUF3095 family protein [Phormidesmis priestleyi]|uniref:DUF3095 family protein n=1 Tax=Phormidesmis priestleyi TaxID=268141 RepID=UPI000934B98A|nr:DUF3095 family protein [Phormidesmis priestleyi]